MKTSSKYSVMLLLLALLLSLSTLEWLVEGDVGLRAEIIVVSSANELVTAIENAQPGDTIEVSNGTYNTDGSLTMTSSGTANEPILIRAQNIGEAELTGDSYFNLRKCAYVIIEGFLLTSTDVTAVKLEACNNIRVTRNIFRLNETSSRKWVIIQGIWNDPNALSFRNRIDHNLFEEKHFPGNFLTIDGSPDPVYQSSQYDLIEYNHFRNIGPRVQNEMEALRIGWSELSMSSGFTVVQNNLFEGCDGDPEIISVKTSDDTIRYNTFVGCQGSLVLRHGNRSVVEGNFFFGEEKPGSGGIRVYGDDHRIYNNYFEGLQGKNWDAALSLTNGDYDGGSNLSRHFRINRLEVVHNTMVNNRHNIEIGFTNNGNYNKPPRDLFLANNLIVSKENELVKIITQPEGSQWVSNILFPDSIATAGIFPATGQISIVDPQMTRQERLLRPAQGSPVMQAADTLLNYVVDDFDGHVRDQMPDIGADEISSQAIQRGPLNQSDVGPFATNIVTGIKDTGVTRMPTAFILRQNYPNPFNPSTTIKFRLLRSAPVKLMVFDIAGQTVDILIDKRLPTGEHSIDLNADNWASGFYFYRLDTGLQAATRKMILLK